MQCKFIIQGVDHALSPRSADAADVGELISQLAGLVRYRKDVGDVKLVDLLDECIAVVLESEDESVIACMESLEASNIDQEISEPADAALTVWQRRRIKKLNAHVHEMGGRVSFSVEGRYPVSLDAGPRPKFRSFSLKETFSGFICGYMIAPKHSQHHDVVSLWIGGELFHCRINHGGDQAITAEELAEMPNHTRVRCRGSVTRTEDGYRATRYEVDSIEPWGNPDEVFQAARKSLEAWGKHYSPPEKERA